MLILIGVSAGPVYQHGTRQVPGPRPPGGRGQRTADVGVRRPPGRPVQRRRRGGQGRLQGGVRRRYWFERNQGKLGALFEAVGEDSILFATDFPHPTCLYPRPVERATETMAALSPEVRAKVLGENARKLYRL